MRGVWELVRGGKNRPGSQGARAQGWSFAGRPVQWRDTISSQISERTEIKFAGDWGTGQCLGHFRESLDLLEPVLSAEIPHRGRRDCKPSFVLWDSGFGLIMVKNLFGELTLRRWSTQLLLRTLSDLVVLYILSLHALVADAKSISHLTHRSDSCTCLVNTRKETCKLMI